MDIEVVKRIKALCPNIDKVRFANSGTGVYGSPSDSSWIHRSKSGRHCGRWLHGLTDEMMWKSDVRMGWFFGINSEIIPFGAGIPHRTRSLVDFIPLNDSEALLKLFQEGDRPRSPRTDYGHVVAFQQLLLGYKMRDTCTQQGALLVIDEVKPVFEHLRRCSATIRMSDLTTYAKAMGNGYPVACFGGRADVMDVIGSGGVVHGGTYKNLVALSAANATLDILANTDALKRSIALEFHQGSLGRVFTHLNRTQICRSSFCLVFI